MSGQQKLRDAKARELVEHVVSNAADPSKVLLSYVREAANDPAQLHFAPHLVTAVCEAGYWPGIQRINQIT